MAEIKTLEQYIITRVQDLEAQVTEQQDQIDDLQVKNEELRKALDNLAPCFRIRNGCNGISKYIYFDGPWNDDPRFATLVSLFGLTEEDEED